MSEQWLPLDGRPHALLCWLDEAYLAFARDLPPRLQAVALARGTYSAQLNDERLERVSSLNPVLAASPWLFWDSFGQLDDRTFLQIAEAGAMLVLASLLLDHLNDRQVADAQRALLLAHALRARAISGFRTADLPARAFWAQFERLETCHLAALNLEIELRQEPRQYWASHVQEIARGKAAPVVVTLTALANACGLEAQVGAIEESLGHAVAASLFADDVMDWRQDLAAGRLTPFLMRLETPETWSKSAWPSPEEVEGAINAGWADVEHLRLAITSLEDALRAVEPVACSHWKCYLRDHRELAERHLAARMTQHVVRAVRSVASPEQGQ